VVVLGLTVATALTAQAPVGGDPALHRKPFPAFDLPTPAGARATLAGYRGQILLVNFWASWCTPCRTEMPMLDTLRQESAGPDFAFLGLNADIDRRHAVKFLATNGLALPIAFGGPRLERTYLYPGLPFTVLVDGEGRLIRRWIGELTRSRFAEIRSAIAAERARRTLGTGERTRQPTVPPSAPFQGAHP
jgi:thiol-disulfide isomerase/thioredoxin